MKSTPLALLFLLFLSLFLNFFLNLLFLYSCFSLLFHSFLYFMLLSLFL